MKSNRSFVPLFATNFLGVINDNFLKTLASFIVMGWITDPRTQSVLMGVTAGALVLPYIFCSALAGRMTGRWRKTRIFQAAKFAELPIMAVAIAGFAMHSAWVVIFSVFLMGLQSSLYSPAKYALVRDVGGEGRVAVGMGGMEGLTFLGMLAGTVLASFVVDRTPPSVHYACLAGFAVAGLLASFTIKADERVEETDYPVNPFSFLRQMHAKAKEYPGLNAVVYTLSVFWWAGATLQMGLLVYGGQVLGLDSFHTGLTLALAAVGITAGQLIAGALDARLRLIEKELPIGWLAAALLVVLYVVPMPTTAFAALLGATAFILGFFKLPFDAEIQRIVKGPMLNLMLAYFNQVSFIFILAASATFALASVAFGPRVIFPVTAVAMFVAPAWFFIHYRRTLCATGSWVLHRRYAVAVDGRDTLKPGKTYLVLPNHPAMVDPMLVISEFGDIDMKPLVDERFFRAGHLAPIALHTVGAVLVPDLRAHCSKAGATIARGLNSVVTGALANGESVIFYPSGHITKSGREEIGTRQLAYNVCRELPENVRIVAIRTKGLWGSIWSYCGRDSIPNFVTTLLKAAGLWIFYLLTFHRRRPVSMHVEDMTERFKEWSETLTRVEFNRKLEAWYDGEEAA